MYIKFGEVTNMILSKRKMRKYINIIITFGVVAFASLYLFSGLQLFTLSNAYAWGLCLLFNGMVSKAGRYRGIAGFMSLLIRYIDIYVSIIITTFFISLMCLLVSML